MYFGKMVITFLFENSSYIIISVRHQFKLTTEKVYIKEEVLRLYLSMN